MLEQLLYAVRRIPQLALRPVARRWFKRIGRNVKFDPLDHFNYREIEIGDNVFIGPGAWFAGRKITIGSNVMFGPRVMIQAGRHDYSATDGLMNRQPELPSELVAGVTIGDDVWIAANVTLIDGARVGDGSVVAAGAVVTGDIPPNSIAAGIPARVIRARMPVAEWKEYRRSVLRKHQTS